MNRYIMIRRLRWPAVLLLIGVLGLLHQTGAIEYFWRFFWPLLMILIGGIMLAERAALAAEGYPMYTGVPFGAGYQNVSPVSAQAATGEDAAKAESAIVAKRHPGFDNDVEGGQQ